MDTNIINKGNLMTSMEYRVTMDKCEKHLGEPLLGLLKPWKSWRFRLAFALVLMGIIALIILVLVLKSRVSILTGLSKDFFFFNIFVWFGIMVLGGVISSIVAPYMFKISFRNEVAEKMRELVNDPELLWLNFVYSKQSMKKIPIDWKKDDKPRISDTNIKVMAFLKKKGTSQALHRVISGFQDSSSGNKHLKRLVTKGLVESTGNDYHYVPFEFTIIDDSNMEVQGEEAQKLKTILNEAWERMIDKNYPGGEV